MTLAASGVFYLLLFAGASLAAALLGLLVMRVGPAKNAGLLAGARPPCSGQATLLPAGAQRGLFVLMPLAALVSAGLAATILLGNVLWQNGALGPHRLLGDVLVVYFLLLVPQAALVLGGLASGTPQAAEGAWRAVRTMSAELPLFLAVLAAVTLGAGAERRFAEEAQRQIDALAGLPESSQLISRPARLARRAALLRDLAERDRLVARHFPEHAALLLRTGWQLGNPSGAEAVAAMAEPAARDLALAAEALRERIARQGSSDRTAAAGLWAEVDRLEAQGRELAALARLAPGCRDHEARIRRLDQALARPGPEVAVRPAVPLRFDHRLALGGAGPEGRLPGQELVSSRVHELLASRRLQASDHEAGLVYTALDGARMAEGARGKPWARGMGAAALVLCVLVGLLCIQAKLALAPFDAAESEAELDGGVLSEYGGPLLGAWKICRAMTTVLLPLFLGLVFMNGFRFWVPGVAVSWDRLFGSGAEGGAGAWLALGRHGLEAGASALKLLGPLAAAVALRSLGLRLQAGQTARFFLGPLTVLAMAALMLAMAGLWLEV